jgi:exodeoxyribonuclease VII large subunit
LFSQQQRRQQLLAHAQHRLQRCHPQQQLEQARQRQHFAGRQLALLILKRIHDTQTRLTHQTALLDTVSPLSTLKRGYAIASDIRQQVITRSTQAKPGMALSVRLADGALDCTVQSIHPATEN